MSAVISGNGLGLFGSSLGQLGSGAGSSEAGQGRQYVNIATGNLVLQAQDEQLLFRGLSIGQLRTYNSLGTAGQVGADGWLTGFERRLELLSGAFNTAGSVMRRYTGDGSYQDFVWTAANTYQSTAGDGAHDTLTWASADRSWTYVEGSSRRDERYADHADATLRGRLTRIGALRSDGSSPAGWAVLYDVDQRIAEIRAEDGTGNGDALVFGYDGSGRLSSVATREGGAVRGQVEYGYDAQGRLTSVLVDLTPADGTGDRDAWDGVVAANNDGYLFRTTYVYADATSLRIAQMRQSDGTLVSYTYDTGGRVLTVTRGDTNTNDADGAGETVTYTWGSGTTTVADSLGRAWSYDYDSQGRLTTTRAPAVSGQSDVTTYAYDTAGNLTQAKGVRGAETLAQMDYQYDANGNLLWQWDALGNAVQRSYSATNQILVETRFTGIDPDRSGAMLPTGGQSTQHVYDARDRLRFVIDATGAVTEYQYASAGNGIGQQSSVRRYLGATYAGAYSEAALAAWATTSQKANSTLVEFGYDLWGRLASTHAYATVDSNGSGVLDAAAELARFTYDAQGLLRHQVALRGAGRTLAGPAQAGSEVVDYVYDGMGRLLGRYAHAVEDAAGDDAASLSTTYVWLDSGYQLAVTQDSGSVRTETRNAAGRVLTVSEAAVIAGTPVTRTSRNYYDTAGQLRASEDANGGRSYFFYDAKGRLEATVDTTGAVSRTVYDGADHVVQTIAYANRVTTAAWLNAGAVTKAGFAEIGVVADSVNDRSLTATYDTAGRLATQVDAAGTITTYSYDAADRLVRVTVTDAAATAATARITRYFHDSTGREVARLDAEGYLTETVHDLAGRPVTVTRHATQVSAALWADGTLAQLRPTPATGDQVTRSYYDGRGNRVGELDAEGYLTEWVFDAAGNVRAERRHANAVAWQSGDGLVSLRGRAGSAYRESRMAYNGRGQLVTQTNAEGPVTRFTYDESGRLVRTEQAQGTTEVREGYRRYNAFDELIGEIDGSGAEEARALLGGKTLDDPTLTQAQLDQAYGTYGVRHEYDVLGRRIESIDAAGNKTWTFYDAAGRPTFVVRGMADDVGLANAQGEVSETRYNAFGQVSDTFTYTGRITLATPGSRASAASAIGALTYASAVDTRRQFAYTTRGLLNAITDAEGAQVRYSYNAFGELAQEVLGYGSSAATTNDLVYDRRGLLTSRTEGSGSAVARTLYRSYDAFGRVLTQTDARDTVTRLEYDRLGRQVTTRVDVQGRTELAVVAYDAFGRTISTLDASGRSTLYTYDDASRSVTVTTPEGTRVVTVHNRHGQTVTVTEDIASGQSTSRTFDYDKSGRLIQSKDELNHATTSEYDARGLLIATVDASGRRVELSYDAAGRVLRRVEDPDGLALTTVYRYDGQGRELTVVDASGRTTAQTYDREGRLLAVAQDPTGLNLRMTYSYDAQDRVLTVTDASGTLTQYAYDALGRRTSEVVDAGTGKLNLTTSYVYDKNDNLIRRVDATGATTRYYYDEANRLIFTVDALGNMTRQWYDETGRVVATRRFVQPTAFSSLTDAATLSELDARLVWNPSDEGEYRIHDKAGRPRWVVGIDGSAQENVYDLAGRVVATRRHATRWGPDAALLTRLFNGTATAADITATANDSADRQSFQVFDAAGRVRYMVDGLGNVRESFYDDADRLVGTRAYALPIQLDASLRAQLKSGTATLATLAAKVDAIDDDARDLRTFTVRDAAGRDRYSIDALGAVTEYLFDGGDRIVGTRRYATTITVDATLLGKLKAGTAAVTDITPRLVADDARDVRTYSVHDAAGRPVLSVDAAGSVRGQSYDGAGRVIAETAFAQPAALTAGLHAQLAAGTATAATVLAVTSQNAAADRSITYVRDAAGRVRYTLTRDGAATVTVSETRYDGAGRATVDVAYGVRIPAGTTATLAAVAAAITAAGGDNASQRTTQYVYDAKDQVRYTVDALGYVSERRYDGLGRLQEARAYNVQVAGVVDAVALDNLLASAIASRRTSYQYDAAGNLTSATDALGKSESYTYDGLGQQLTRTDKLNNTWTYAYDAAGRRVSETSPQVTVATVDLNGSVTSTTRAVVTTFGYDALGNVVSRTENAGQSDARVTQYAYDNRGNQIQTLFPDAHALNGSGELVATGVRPTIEVIHDALGRAVVQKDVLGNHSYKVYDAAGRLAYDVDQEGLVTRYAYNAYGEQTGLTRYAQPLNIGALPGWSAGQVLSLAHMEAGGALSGTDPNNRSLATAYDQAGRKVSVTQSAVSYYKADGTAGNGSPVSQYAYDAYGRLVKESILQQGTAGQADAVWADTWRYYDAAGRLTLLVDAQGYVTAHSYNGNGDPLETIEYARTIDTAGLVSTTRPGLPAPGDATTGYDRITRWTHDALGRKVGETTVRHYQRADGSSGVRDIVSSFAYDASGRVTGLTTDAGTTTTAYDALGRAVSVVEPQRTVLKGSAEGTLLGSTGSDLSSGIHDAISPYTELTYDAFGNLVRSRRYANGLSSGQSTPVADNNRDQIEVTRYDRQGRAVMTVRPDGTKLYSAYDEADHVTRTWYFLNGSDDSRDATITGIYGYDRIGRQLTSRQERQLASGGAILLDSSENVGYNAFGEIVQKTQGGMSGTLTYTYDGAGRLIASNEGGAPRNFGYNLAGHQLREWHTAYLSAGQTVQAVTLTFTDKLGRAIGQRQPSYQADTAAFSQTNQRLDRWGNVVQIIDARGYQTNYQYNDHNQLIRDERPLVQVVAENGATTWVRPVNQWLYDPSGRLLATRDANGHVRENEYDAAGQLIRSTDAMGQSTLYAYDVFGNQRMQQNALGYITFKEYDSQNRVVAIGDFLPDETGTHRAKAVLQQYRLNENGDRIRVTDALSFASLYDYDGRSQLIRSQTATGVVQSYAYDAQGHKVRESNALSEVFTYTDREGEIVKADELTWDYDIHGRLIDHNNLSGRDYDYGYDAASGQQTAESASGGRFIASGDASKTMAYYANGLLREIVEGNGTVYRYEYDAAGNRTLEQVITRDGGNQTVQTLTRTWYDSHNRVQRVTQDDQISGKRVFDLTYEYDAVGNRRHVVALSGYGPNLDGVPGANTAPVVVNPVADRTVRKGRVGEFRVLFSDVFRDAEQDRLSLTITQAGGSALPGWLQATVDATTGEIVFIANPPAGLADQDVVVQLNAYETLTPSNMRSTSFTVRVRTNTTPELVAGSISTLSKAKIGQAWGKSLSAREWFRDVDVGDKLSLSVVNPGAMPAWLQIDASNPDVVHLSGTANATGTYDLQIRATDEAGASIVKTFRFEAGPNVAPNATVPAPSEAILGRSFEWVRDLASVFIDPDGDALQVTATGLPNWMYFQFQHDQAVPAIKLAGLVPAGIADGTSYTITFTATDPDGLSKTTTLIVTAKQNRAPAGNSWTAPSLRVNDPYDVTVPISTLFNDPEGDLLSIEPIWPAGSQLPSWLKISVDQTARTVRLFGTPTSNTQAGSLSFQLRARDGDGLTGVANLAINVIVDNAPVRTSTPVGDVVLDIGRSFSFTLPVGMFTEADGDGIVLSASEVMLQESTVPDTYPPQVTIELVYLGLPSWLTFNPTTRTFSGTVPLGTSPRSYAIRIDAQDGRHNPAMGSDTVGGAGDPLDNDITITLQPFVNQRPIYNGGLPNRTVVHGGAVDFALPAGAFTEPNGDGLTYTAEVLVGGTWQSISAIGLAINASTGRITGTASNLIGPSISARITARDPEGLSNANAGAFTFNVTNTAPVAGAIPAQTAYRKIAFNLSTAAYFSDVNQDAFAYSASGLPSGLSINASTGVISGGSDAAPGTYSVTVTVNDGRGGTASSSFNVTVANNAPGAPTISNVAAAAGTAWTYTIPAFSDPNGDTLTYTVSGMPGWMTFDAATRRFAGTPGAVGSWSITVSVKDPYDATASATFTVSTPNEWPSRINDIPAQTRDRNMSWSYQVPSNTFADKNGDSLTYSASNLPAGVTFDAATRTFSGNVQSLGTYAIAVTASDGRGGTANATLSISIVNSAPALAVAAPNRFAQHNQAVVWTLPAGAFTDANGDVLTYTAEVEIPAHEVGYWNEGDQAWDFRPVAAQWALLSRSGLTLDPATGTLSGTVTNLAASGSTFFSYRVRLVATDTAGASAEAIFNVSLNQAPTTPFIANQSTRAGKPWSFVVPAFTDADGDGISYSMSGLPSGLWFDPSTRTISGTGATPGDYAVSIFANDGRGGVTTRTFTLTLRANNAPAAPSIPVYNATQGQYFSSSLPLYSDADSDPMSYSVSGLPAGLAFDPSTCTIYGTPTTSGTFWVNYYANDGMGGTGSTSFQLAVNAAPPQNQAPFINVYLADLTSTKGKPFTHIIPINSFVDPEGGPLTYSAIQNNGNPLPTWLTFNPGTRTFSGTPSGSMYQQWEIRVTVTDTSGLSVSDTFWLEKEGFESGLMSAPVDAFDMGMALAPEEGEGGSIEGPAAQAAATAAPQRTEYWYTYDAENRIKVNNGKLANGQIVTSLGNIDSWELLYDAVGQEVGRVHHNGHATNVYRTAFDLRGNKTLEFYGENVGGPSYGVEKEYRYDAAGRLTATRNYHGAGAQYQVGTDDGYQPIMMDVGGWLWSSQDFTYDMDGRLLTQQSRVRPSNTEWWLALYRDGANGEEQRTNVGVLDLENTVSYVGGYDSAGRAFRYTYTSADIGGDTHTYTTSFQGWDTYQEKTVTGLPGSNPNYKTTSNTLTYDGFGRLLSQREHTDNASLDDRIRYYAYNGEARVQSRSAGTLNGSGQFVQTPDGGGLRDNTLFVHAAGQQQAELGEGGRIRPMAVGSYLSGTGRYQAGGGKVVVQSGESLSMLAKRLYGSESLWYVLADANGLSDPHGLLAEGTSLNAPSVNVNSNDASTFRPYNPSEAIGSTSPSLPYIPPPPKEGCNNIVMLIAVVVAVVVTIYTAGVASAALAPGAMTTGAMGFSAAMSAGVGALSGVAGLTTAVVGGAAIGGAMGSVASQAVLIAGGVQKGFDWKGVGLSAIGAGATAGLGGVSGGISKVLNITSGAGQAVVAGGVNSAVTSGLGSALDLTSFNWKSVAISAVAAGVGYGAGKLIGRMQYGNWADISAQTARTDWGQTAVRGFGSGLIAGAASAEMRGGLSSEALTQVGLDALGSAVGNALGNAAADRAAQRSLQAQWDKEDAVVRQQLIAKEELERNSASWQREQGAISGYRGPVIEPNNLALAGPTGYRKTGRVKDNAPVIVEPLPEYRDSRTWINTANGGYVSAFAKAPSELETQVYRAAGAVVGVPKSILDSGIALGTLAWDYGTAPLNRVYSTLGLGNASQEAALQRLDAAANGFSQLAQRPVGTFVDHYEGVFAEASRLDTSQDPYDIARAAAMRSGAYFEIGEMGVSVAAATRPLVRGLSTIGREVRAVGPNARAQIGAVGDLDQVDVANTRTATISNKFPLEALDPQGRIFGKAQIIDGRVTLGAGRQLPRDVDFVVTQEGELMLGRKHTTLANGQDVLAAGRLKLTGNGQVRLINNLSGHYKPTLSEASVYPSLFEKLGVNVSGARLQIWDILDNGGYVTTPPKPAVDWTIK